MNEMWRDAEDHRSLPFASMPHLPLMDAAIGFVWSASQVPISRRQKKQVAAATSALSDFKDCLPCRHIVAAMAVKKDQPCKSVMEKVLHQAAQEIEVDARRAGERSGKIDVVIGVAQPHERGKENTLVEPLRNASHNFPQQ